MTNQNLNQLCATYSTLMSCLITFFWFPSWSFMSYLYVPVFTQMYRIFSKNFELPLLSSSHCETCVDMGTNKSSWPSEESYRQHICLLHSRMHTWKWKIIAASIHQCMALTYKDQFKHLGKHTILLHLTITNILSFKMILRCTGNFY